MSAPPPSRIPVGGLLRHRKLRKAAAMIVAWLPGSGLRKAAYRLLHGYRFGPGTRIAHGVFIAVDTFVTGADVRIARGNRFYGPIHVELGDKTYVGPRNEIMCGDAVVDDWAAARSYGRALIVGRDCLINQDHLFDVVGTIRVGNGAWLAGFRSQFVTHGASVMNRDIEIGADSFLGSAVLMAPGTALAPSTLLAMGSLVTKVFEEPNMIVGGVPAKPLRARSSEDEHSFEKVW
jgi:acetyltransferase-like isoleucine patch superfamily enzyme